jgi:type II secretory pathway pseudopilin PulG
MKKALQIVLLVAIVVLGYMLYSSITTPIRYEDEQAKRNAKVIERLKDIRTAQVAYKSEFGRYTGSFDTLVRFVKTGNFNVEQRFGSADDSIAVAKGLLKRVKIQIKVIDSLFKGNMTRVDSLPFIPYGGGSKFEMGAGEIMTASKVPVKVFEVKAPDSIIFRSFVAHNKGYRQILVNKTDEKKKADKYPGLKVGSLTEATNNAGNWE